MADKKALQDVRILQSHWPFSLFCFSLWGFITFLPTLAASFLQLFFSGILLFFLFPFLGSLPYTLLLPPLVISFLVPYGERLLSFPVGCNLAPVNAGIFLLETHSTIQLKTRASLQQSWIQFPHSTLDYCLTVKTYTQRRHFIYRQLISEKVFVPSLAQKLVIGG